MTGPELKAIRKKLGLSTREMARAIGWEGSDDTVQTQIRKYESGSRPIPPWIANLVHMYGKHGVDASWLKPQ
jgi:transcriptional regulator with XRE-family HTH domain